MWKADVLAAIAAWVGPARPVRVLDQQRENLLLGGRVRERHLGDGFVDEVAPCATTRRSRS